MMEENRKLAQERKRKREEANLYSANSDSIMQDHTTVQNPNHISSEV